MLFLQFLGFLVGVLLSPSMTAKMGRKWMLTLALICIVAAYLLLGWLPSWEIVLLLTVIVGFGSGIIEPSVGAFTIEFTENQKAVAMSKLDVFFALGALLIPPLRPCLSGWNSGTSPSLPLRFWLSCSCCCG